RRVANADDRAVSHHRQARHPGGVPGGRLTTPAPQGRVPAPLTPTRHGKLTPLDDAPHLHGPSIRSLPYPGLPFGSPPAIVYTAVVHWGAGSPDSTATVDGAAGVFRVQASHHFAPMGDYTPTVTITDGEGATATATAAIAIGDTVTGGVTHLNVGA